MKMTATTANGKSNCATNEPKTLPVSETYKKLDARIDELYVYRDKFYIDKGWTSEAERNADVSKRVDELVAEIEATDESELGGRARRLVLVGKTLNLLAENDQRTFEALTRAIKLEPSAYDAWNYLGECYWKSKDFEMCRNCFERSLAIERNKRALRGMSIVMRQLMKIPTTSSSSNKSKDQSEKSSTVATPNAETIRTLLDESIKYAKEALQLDASDGMSWYTLANSYVAKFFSPFGGSSSSSAPTLKQAIQAFNLASRDEKTAVWQTDLFYNKAMLSMYEEDWPDVLSSLTRAINLDPHWTEVRESLRGVIVYLVQLSELLVKKAKLKPKKFQALIDSMKPTDLGPYSEFLTPNSLNTVAESQANQKIKLTQARLKDLVRGANPNKLLVGKVLGMVSAESISKNLSIVCYTCCIADAAGDCAALTIYNLAAGNGLVIGDSVAIPEPWCERVDVSYSLSENFKSPVLLEKIRIEITQSDDGSGLIFADQMNDRCQVKFESVRVENPTVLVVNGKKWSKDKLSSAFFVPKVVAD